MDINKMPLMDFTDRVYEERSYNKGDIIYHDHEDVVVISQIVKGRIKLVTRKKNYIGAWVQDFLQPGSYLGSTEIIGRILKYRFISIAQDNNVILKTISISQFIKNHLHNEYQRPIIMQDLIQREANLWKRYQAYSSSTLLERVKISLEILSTNLGVETKNGILIEGISHRDLADYTGISRQSFTTIMNILRKINYVEYTRNRILIKRTSI